MSAKKKHLNLHFGPVNWRSKSENWQKTLGHFRHCQIQTSAARRLALHPAGLLCVELDTSARMHLLTFLFGLALEPHSREDGSFHASLGHTLCCA